MWLSLAKHAKKFYNHHVHGDYNAEFLYSPLKIKLKAGYKPKVF